MHFNREDIPVTQSEIPPDDKDRQDVRETGSSPDSYRGPEIRTDSWSNVTTYTYYYNPQPPQFELHHDREKRVFEVTGPDGHKSAFQECPLLASPGRASRPRPKPAGGGIPDVAR